MAVLADRLTARPPADTTWLLDVAERVLRGARYGEDILEVAPPMILVLKLPVVALGRMLHVDPLVLWYLGVCGLAWVSILCTVSLMRGTTLQARLPAAVLLAALLWAALVLPGGDVGQKDHLTGLLVLPYVAIAVRRLSALPVGSSHAVVAGIAGAVGIGLKPHFVLLPLAISGLQVRYDGRRALRHPELWAAAATLLAYLALVAFLAPGYIHFVVQYGGLYQSYLPMWYFTNLGWDVVPPLAVVTSYAWARRRFPPLDRRAGDVLALSAFAFVLTGLAQGKGWAYHFLPATLMAQPLLVGVLLPSLLPAGQRARLEPAWVLVGLAAASWAVRGAAVLTMPSWRSPEIAAQKANDRLLRAAIQRWSAPGEAVGVLSVAIESSFPLLYRTGRPWAFRFPHMWPLVAYHREEIYGDGPISRPHAGAAAYLAVICEDLRKATPRVLLVVPARTQRSPVRVAYGFDYLRYLSTFPPLGAALAGYEDRGAVGGYRVLVRTGAGAGVPLGCGAQRGP